MSRKLRYVPEGVRLVHVTCRAIQGRYLFTPSQRFNDIALGVFGRAQRMHPIRICEIGVVSGHFHILFDVDSVQQLSDFMEYAGSNLAREVNRLTGWSGPVFERRYSMIPVSNEVAAQVEVLKYVIGHGVKEGLVERVVDWPGIHSAKARLLGEPLTGHWFSRKDEYAARRHQAACWTIESVTEETVVLSPIPCWEHLPAEEYRECIRGW